MNSELPLLSVGEFFAKSTVVLLLAALVSQAWRGASAAQRHFIWMAAIIIVLLLPLTRLVAPWWSIAVAQPADIKPMVSMPAEMTVTVETIAPSATVPDSVRPTPAQHLPGWRSILLGIWLTGCAGLVGYRLIGLWNLRHLEKHGMSAADERVQTMATSVLEAMEIKRPVRVRLSIDCRVPMTWGFVRPILVLPWEAVQWDDARLAAALRHEAGHIARHDYPVRWIAHLACSIYWMNPLIWLAAKSLRITQEQATNDLVLRAGTPPEDYAAQLFDSARLVASHGIFARHAVAMATPSTLESRVLAIVDEQRDRRPLGRMSAVVGALATTSLLALCAVAQLQAASPDAAKSSEPSPTSNPPATAQLSARDRAGRIVIPKIEFRETPLAECVAFLRKQSKDLSSDGEGINIFVKAPPTAPDARITLDLTNVPLIEAATYVAGLANLALNAEPSALVIGPGPAPKTSADFSRPQPPRGVMKRAQEIVIPKLEFREATLQEAVDLVRNQAREFDPEKTGINIVLQPGITSDARITVSFNDIPVSEALRYVAGLSDTEVRDFSEADAMMLVPKGLLTRPSAPVAAAIKKAVPLNITADSLTMDAGVVTANGHVEVKGGASTLKADYMRMKSDTRWMEASGNVEVTNGNTVTTATGAKLVVEFQDNGGVSFAGPHKTSIKVPQGIPVPGKPGYLKSPYSAEAEAIDARGLAPGAEVKCPYSGKTFVVPPTDGGASNSRPPTLNPRVAGSGNIQVDSPSPIRASSIQEPAKESPMRVRIGGDLQISSSFIDRKPIGRRPGEN